MNEARGLLRGVMRDNDGLEGPDGRLAYGFPRAPSKIRNRPRGGCAMDPTSEEARSRARGNVNRIAKWTRDTRYYLPSLPEVAIPGFMGLTAAQQEEVQSLRRYYINLRKFRSTFRSIRGIVAVWIGIPCLLLLGVYLCGLERVPLTGRWRIILLTPEEENDISSNLTDQNWYRSVINLLTTSDHPAPPVVPLEDWRWRWVQHVLNRLETAVNREFDGKEEASANLLLHIPKPAYPLRPRSRMSSMLHSILPGGDADSSRDNIPRGLPYSFMIMDKDEVNAFSYGFSGQSTSGIVVFTGLLDDILRRHSDQPSTCSPRDIRSRFVSSIFGGSSPSQPLNPQPSDAQTLHLACVLAHEMGHLLMSHHLEVLSQQQVLWPSILGLVMDLTRAIIWPLT